MITIKFMLFIIRIKLVKVIDPDHPQPTEDKPVLNKKKKERFGYLDRRLKRLKNLALANSLEEVTNISNKSKPCPPEVVVDGGANPQPVLMAKTENFVHNPFEQNQEVKVNRMCTVYKKNTCTMCISFRL